MTRRWPTQPAGLLPGGPGLPPGRPGHLPGAGRPQGQANSLRELGVALRAVGRREEARARWLEALATFDQLQATEADQVRALVTDLTTMEDRQ